MQRRLLAALVLAVALPAVALAADPMDPFAQQQADMANMQSGSQPTPQQVATALPNTSRDAQQLSGALTTSDAQQNLSAQTLPFGADLFRGRFSRDATSAYDPGYIIMPGDGVTIQMWGAVNQDLSQSVDIQGNVFLPGVGPVKLQGVPFRELENTVRKAVANVYTSNVSVYTNLQKPQPVAIFVTGNVANPGRYTGSARDTVLFFLDRAGGVSLSTGSFRDLRVMRGDKQVVQIDLYDFLLEGRLSRVRLEDGDVIMVGSRGASVSVRGDAKKAAAYEWSPLTPAPLSGKELLRLARPLPTATHALISGTRDGAPFQNYLAFAEFENAPLADGDSVNYYSDALNTSIAVTVKGAQTGPSVLTVKRSAKLRELLAHIPVETETANLSGIHVLRKSVADQQKKALQDSLRRLERSVLTQTSGSREESLIRAQEAEMIAKFVDKAKQIQPDGLVVVADGDQVRNIALEAGDVIMVPQKSDVVLINGEVQMPATVVYAKGRSLDYYVQQAGGYSARGNRDTLVVRPNGKVEVNPSDITPGDQILVMPAADTKLMPFIKDLTQVIYQIAVGGRMVDLVSQK